MNSDMLMLRFRDLSRVDMPLAALDDEETCLRATAALSFPTTERTHISRRYLPIDVSRQRLTAVVALGNQSRLAYFDANGMRLAVIDEGDEAIGLVNAVDKDTRN